MLVQIEDGRGALLVNLILGTVPTAGHNFVYVRRPATIRLGPRRADLPPLQDAAAWLDLARDLDRKSRIAHVDVAPEQGAPYAVNRDDPHARDFALAKPFDRFLVTTPEGPNGVAEAIALLAPIDVAGAPSIKGRCARALWRARSTVWSSKANSMVTADAIG